MMVHGPLLAELLAFKLGLTLAWSLGMKHLICESDSLDIVKALNNPTFTYCHSFTGVVKEVLELLRMYWNVKVQHVFREANVCADHFTKLGARSDYLLKLWSSSPEAWMLCWLMMLL